MDKIIPVRISDTIIKRLDLLIHEGIFRNRNEVIRTGLRALINYYRKYFQNKSEIARIISNYIFDKFSDEIYSIILFGSVALNLDNKDSDIDLFILTRDRWSYTKRATVYEIILPLLYKLDVVISLHFEELNLFQVAIQDDLIFEKGIYKNGIVLSGVNPINFKNRSGRKV